MADKLLHLYAQLPAWLVAVGLAMAAGSFVASYVYQARFGRARLNPALALPVAAVLLSLAMFYLVIAPSDLPTLAKAAVTRLLWLSLSACLVLYNGGMVFGLIGKLRD